MPYYPFIASDSGKPTGNTGDTAIATDTRKMYLNVSGDWFEMGQSVALVTLSGTVAKGELIGYSSGWVRASKTVGGVIPARFVALKAGVSGDIIPVANRAIIDGSGFTANAMQYLSTLGTITATRSTTAGDLRQKVGVALSTTQVMIDLSHGFREVSVPMRAIKYTGAEGDTMDTTALDSSIEVFGYALNAQNEHLTYMARLPENFISILRVPIAAAQDTATGGGTAPTHNIAVASVLDAASWDGVTADTSETSKTLATNAAGDPIVEYDAVAAFNATSVAQPGAWLFMDILKSDAGTVETLIFGAEIVCLVTD